MIELTVRGMDCAHCVRAVTEAVQELDPGAVVEVDLGTGQVRADTSAARDAVVKAITAEGYEVAEG